MSAGLPDNVLRTSALDQAGKRRSTERQLPPNSSSMSSGLTPGSC